MIDQIAQQSFDAALSLSTQYLRQYGAVEAGSVDVFELPPVVFPRREFVADTYAYGAYYTKKLIGQGVDPEQAWDKAVALAEGRLGQTILSASRSLISSAEFEYHGRPGRWRRVTDGHPCAFCAMLAGRGPVYRSGDNFRTHHYCGCNLEPVLSEWVPSRQEAAWRASYLLAVSEAELEYGRGWARRAAGEGNILARMRRNSPQLFHDGVFAREGRSRSEAHRMARGSDGFVLPRSLAGAGTGSGGNSGGGRLWVAGSDGGRGQRWRERFSGNEKVRGIKLVPRNPPKDYHPPAVGDISRDRIAPAANPWKYLEDNGVEVAGVLHGLRVPVLSVLEDNRGKSPDAVLLDLSETIEFKLQTTSSDKTFPDNIRKNRGQSENLAFLLAGEANFSRLESVMVKYVYNYGHGNRFVIGMSQDGKAVYWVNEE